MDSLRRKVFLMVISLAFLVAKSGMAQNGQLHISFADIKKKGEVHAAIWESESSFLGKKPFQGKIVAVTDGKAVVHFQDLPYGTYAVSVFLDTNGNRKLDTNIVGIPKEPYAFSNNASGLFGPPKFSEASFEIKRPLTEIQISF